MSSTHYGQRVEAEVDVADTPRWSSAGPVIEVPLRRRILAMLGRVGLVTGGATGPLPHLDDLDCHRALAALASARSALESTSTRYMGAATALSELVAVHELEQRLADLELCRRTECLQALTRVLPRLEAVPCAVPELVALAPELICDLGFDRGLISRVADNVWYPELMFVMGDPAWAAEITQAGKSKPLELVEGLHETELVRERRAILVTDAQSQSDDRWGHPGMVEASQTQSYVAAPIMSAGRVVGILTGDRYGQRRQVDEVDRDLLAAFAEVFRLVLSRASIGDTLRSAQQLLSQMSTTLEEAYGAVHEMPVVRVDRHPGEAADGMVVRSGPRVPITRPLPATLTPREVEVLELMAAGRTNLAIASHLVIADGTVKQHVKHILRKLGATNRSEAVARWFQAGAGSA